jgi:putative oxidoreductase
MTPHATTRRPAAAETSPGPAAAVIAVNRALARIPHSLIGLIARFSIAAVFWKSGQTKVEGLAIDIVDGTFRLGWPRLSSSAVDLFRDEYKVPLLSPEAAAIMATLAEHALPVLILLGLATRLSALGLLVMTAVIQVFVYPDAYPAHGVWAAVLLFLIARGPGVLSIDHLIARRFGPRTGGH